MDFSINEASWVLRPPRCQYFCDTISSHVDGSFTYNSDLIQIHAEFSRNLRVYSSEGGGTIVKTSYSLILGWRPLVYINIGTIYRVVK